jgi:hypothetical protein
MKDQTDSTTREISRDTADVGALVARCLAIARSMGHSCAYVQIQDPGVPDPARTREPADDVPIIASTYGGSTRLACAIAPTTSAAIVQMHQMLLTELRAYHQRAEGSLAQASRLLASAEQDEPAT